MKMIKISLLAVAMMVASSVVAMENATQEANAALEKCKNLVAQLGDAVPEEQRLELVSIERTITQAIQDSSVGGLKRAKTGLENLHRAITFGQSKLGKIVLPTMAFITTHPKKLGVLTAVAVVAAAYLVYKKLIATKKSQAVEKEDETEAVTVK